jgi:hypothetical protein
MDRHDFAVRVEFENGQPVARVKSLRDAERGEPFSLPAYRQSNQALIFRDYIDGNHHPMVVQRLTRQPPR